jgi:hypothetical protein
MKNLPEWIHLDVVGSIAPSKLGNKEIHDTPTYKPRIELPNLTTTTKYSIPLFNMFQCQLSTPQHDGNNSNIDFTATIQQRNV